MVALRQQIACADVDETSAENTQNEAQRIPGDRVEERRTNSQHRRDRIDREPSEGLAAFTFISDDHRYGIDPVGKIVRQNRNRHERSHGRGYLEREADNNSIEKAVGRKAS